jgi:hypothetical protein
MSRNLPFAGKPKHTPEKRLRENTAEESASSRFFGKYRALLPAAVPAVTPIPDFFTL